MSKDRGSCGQHEELARTTDFRMTRCACGTLHLHVTKSGVTFQLNDTMLAELVNVSTAAHRKVEALHEAHPRLPSSAPTN